ncbi:MAG: hypothetical protein GX321_04780 [Clostridiales bacterium]|nr:hypothetical protein [Clostridiales bacterium]
MKKSKLISTLTVATLIVILAVVSTKIMSNPKTDNDNNKSNETKGLDTPENDENTEASETPVNIISENDHISEGSESNQTDDSDKSQDKQQYNILDLADAKKIIESVADKVITAISEKDGEAISVYVHPLKGLRFTPYTFVSLERDMVFSKEDMKKFFDDTNQYLWGYYDGSGDEIKLTPSEYYDRFIYSEDFISAPQVGYNEVLSFGNMLENQFEVYESPIVVEYYFPGFDPDYEGLDWKSLRLVFELYEDDWKLVGIIHNQWTI